MEQFRGQSILNFIKELPDDDACKAYLAKIKWQNGFVCSKCGHSKGCQKAGYTYQCYQCNHVESSTSNTLFHKVKFGLHKAFCVVFEMSTSSKSISSIQMGKRFNIRQGTAWYFMDKVRKAIESSSQNPLKVLVHVDEFTVGEMKEQRQGRSYHSKKKKAVIAVELTDKKKTKRAYIKSIADYSTRSLRPLFEAHINKEDNPTHATKCHIQRYFDEFCFRLNRSRSRTFIFHKTIERMVQQQPFYNKDIKQMLCV